MQSQLYHAVSPHMRVVRVFSNGGIHFTTAMEVLNDKVHIILNQQIRQMNSHGVIEVGTQDPENLDEANKKVNTATPYVFHEQQRRTGHSTVWGGESSGVWTMAPHHSSLLHM